MLPANKCLPHLHAGVNRSEWTMNAGPQTNMVLGLGMVTALALHHTVLCRSLDSRMYIQIWDVTNDK